MATNYPQAWSYLQSWEEKLRGREGNSFNDGDWYRFGRHQNLDKQEIEKLIVPRLVSTVSCSVDITGSKYLDNVDVGGVTSAAGIRPFFLAAVLNGPVASFVFRRISKPFRGNYRSANKQYIAPLPVPRTSEQQRDVIAQMAEHLQRLHTERRDILEAIDHRRSVMRIRSKSEKWLFPDLPRLEDLEDQAPRTLDIEQRSNLARQRFDEELARRHDRLGERLSPGIELSAELTGGELRFLVDGVVVVDRVFVRDEEGPFIAAQWKVLAATIRVTASSNGKRLSSSLRRLAVAADNPEAARQIVEYERELEAIEGQIADAETEMNQLLYSLYGLDEDEVRRIEQG